MKENMDEFLRGSWNDLSVLEKQGNSSVAESAEMANDNEKMSDIDIYRQISDIDASLNKKRGIPKEWKEFMHECFNDIQSGISNYINTILTQKQKEREGEYDKDEDEMRSQDRVNSHNALITNLNILARTYKKFDLDTRWEGMLQLKPDVSSMEDKDRQRVQIWAANVMSFIASRKEADSAKDTK